MIQVALAAQWRAWGIRPAALIGHSVGEIAAAHLAGVLTLEDAVKLVLHRSAVMQFAVGGSGGMVQLSGISAAEVEASLRAHGDRPEDVSIGTVNSDNVCVLSGVASIVEQVGDVD